jgi:hypothetical protein
MITSPVARIVTGVLAELRAKVITTPPGIVTVVKLNTPLAGTCMVWLVAGENAPSVPVEPLLNCASAG